MSDGTRHSHRLTHPLSRRRMLRVAAGAAWLHKPQPVLAVEQIRFWNLFGGEARWTGRLGCAIQGLPNVLRGAT